MTVISGIDVSDTIQIIFIAIIGTAILLILLGIAICCCRRGSGDAQRDMEAQRNKLREITHQSSSYLPKKGSDQPIPLLGIAVRRWRQLVALDPVHVCGAELRFRKLVAQCAAANSCYYLDEGPCDAESEENIKWVTAANPSNLMDAHVASNAQLLSVYDMMVHPGSTLGKVTETPFQGLQIFCLLHSGSGAISAAATDGAPLKPSGSVADETKAILAALLQQQEQADGSVILSDAFLRHSCNASTQQWMSWSVLQGGLAVNWHGATPTPYQTPTPRQNPIPVAVASPQTVASEGVTVVEILPDGGTEYGDTQSPGRRNQTGAHAAALEARPLYLGSNGNTAPPELVEVEELES
eukprot:CAMPEP_0176409822 /NCGR_PEP_ID=MMETSP0127-20121128/2710_1 /TAXON_ID=938130 /ORGANISM="Platyophrya macrostoma, Strain WH" /LENGTH=353 /DNA_ID=CAMNT_0017789241 /DNA_START=37 /DNA_END=1098 /DNA_ORIENTATION=+